MCVWFGADVVVVEGGGTPSRGDGDGGKLPGVGVIEIEVVEWQHGGRQMVRRTGVDHNQGEADFERVWQHRRDGEAELWAC